MKRFRKLYFFKLFGCILILQIISFTLRAQQITTGSLLDEMVNREELTKFPNPAYKCAQFSSYDQHSTTPDENSWYANWDRSYWLRVEKNSGRREFVMMDIDGPGAVVRFWVTVAGYGGNGTLRVYLDNIDEPVIEGEIFSLLSGNVLAPDPLAASVSKHTNYLQRGHNLYLPIPYASHCKITYESDAQTEAPGAQKGEALYYNINYRTYEEGTKVASFSKDDLTAYKDKIDLAVNALNSPNNSLTSATDVNLNGTIAPNKEITKEFEGEQMIRRLSMKLSADDIEQALRSTVLEISFDGAKTVWCPVGDFFGTGYKISPFTTFYTSTEKDGTLISNWLMPFKKNCTLKIRNYGNQDVTVSECAISTADYNWTAESMYFGAGWFEKYKLYTGDGSRPMDGNNDGFFDLNYVTLTGKGVLVGTGVTLFNAAGQWWGEGDEKVYVDNETFPSHFGTGTEDYYGYAWCRPEKFSHPYLAQPDGSGNLAPGYTVNQRYRGLDGIPFTQNLTFDMEIWHWAATTINYAPVTYWYMLPGGKTNRVAVPEQLKNQVVLEPSDFYSKTPNEQGRIEAEYLKVTATKGNIRSQAVSEFNWSNGTQVWWTGAQPGDKATLQFEIEEENDYNLKVRLTKARDYGIYAIYLDGGKNLKSF